MLFKPGLHCLVDVTGLLMEILVCRNVQEDWVIDSELVWLDEDRIYFFVMVHLCVSLLWAQFNTLFQVCCWVRVVVISLTESMLRGDASCFVVNMSFKDAISAFEATIPFVSLIRLAKAGAADRAFLNHFRPLFSLYTMWHDELYLLKWLFPYLL